MKEEAKNPLYLRPGSDKWVMILYDPETRRRIKRSTGKTDYEEALTVYRRALAELKDSIGPLTVGAMLDLYSDPKTNPRYKIAQVEGTRYGADHANSVAGQARALKKLLQVRAPAYLKKEVSEIRKLEIKNIRQAIIDVWGQRRKSQETFATFKTMMAQCAEDGYIEISPAKDVRDIPYKSKQRPSFPAEEINRVLALKDVCPEIDKWAFFAIMATTGMRMSEVLALSERQIYKGTLTIDAALKTNSADDIGLPKYDLVRIIPLSQITLEILSYVKPDKNGRYFRHNRNWGSHAVRDVLLVACSMYPEDRDLFATMTSHTLRHSMNTNLLASGLPPLLVAEYLSWNHQCLLDMQQRYTHVYAEALRPVAEKIDELYCLPSSAANFNSQKSDAGVCLRYGQR